MNITIAGRLDSASFQQAVDIAMSIKEPTYKFNIIGMVPTDWELYLEENKNEFTGLLGHSCIVFDESRELVGSTKSFEKWAMHVFQYHEKTTHQAQYSQIAKKRYEEYLKSTGHSFVYFDFDVDNESIGRVIIELFNDCCPNAIEIFKKLCNSKYKGTEIYRIVNDGWIQGGDNVNLEQLIPDECFHIKHDKPGILGFAKHGPNENQPSQFYITLKPMSWMDKAKYMAFGRVIDGMKIIRSISRIKTYESEKPTKSIIIKDCVRYFCFSLILIFS